ncbi:sensor histidine kinase [Streptomyces abikoensis]
MTLPDDGPDTGSGAGPDDGPDHGAEARTDPGARRLALVMHAAFFLLLSASFARFLIRHPGEPRTPWIVALSVLLALLYVLSPAFARPAPQLLWPAAVVAAWVVLVVLAPSFAWCSVPLLYTGLRTLPARAAVLLVAFLTGLVVVAQLRLAHGFDPTLVLAPPAVAAVATAVFLHMQRQTERQRALIGDLVRTRRELAATERREGALAERQRLSMEIHDTLAQGLSSQRMLLQAADRTWDADPQAARRHTRTAAEIAARGLAEARRFVDDLAAPQFDGGARLEDALRALAASETAEGTGTPVLFHLDGTPVALPDGVRAALLRIAQGALANVREHAGAATAALTLSYLGDQVVLDVADDGRGFAPGSPPVPAGGRGHGLPAMRARVRQVGGTLTIESAPGEGTVVSACVPLEPQ